MIKDLVKLANDLDAKGLSGEADLLDRLIQKWAQNPGNAFNAAQRQGAEANAEAAKTKLTAEVQKTVDWFNNEVLPAVRSGGPLALRVPQDLVYRGGKTGKDLSGYIKDYIVAGQTISSLSQGIKTKSISRDASGKVIHSGSSTYQNLASLYSFLEAFVIKNNLRVTMESDVSEELDKKEKIS